MKLSTTKQKQQKRDRRHIRIRARVRGTPERPRLAIFKSNTNVYAQIIDDTSGNTLVGAASIKSTVKGKTAKAQELGTMIAQEAQKKGISAVVFDRGGFMYTGVVATFADAARKGGLLF